MIKEIWERALQLFGRKKEEELKEQVAEARSKGECSEKEALEMAK